MARLLETTNKDGVVERAYREDDKIHIRQTQDVSEILRLNQIDRSHSHQTGGMRKAATIPITVWAQWREQLKRQGRNPDPWAKENRPWLIATLNNKEWLKLRTNEDRL